MKKTFFSIALKKIFGIIYEKQKKKKLKLFEETKNKLLEELEESKIFSQIYILYDISGILKQTFVSELEKFTNTYSQFTIFWKKNKKQSKFQKFYHQQQNIFFQLKNDYNGEKGLSLLLRKLNGSPTKLFSNKISVTFLVK